LDAREREAIAAAFEPQRHGLLKFRVPLLLFTAAALLYGIFSEHLWLLLPTVVASGLLEELVTRRLKCPQCAYVFTASDGWKPKRCRQCRNQWVSQAVVSRDNGGCDP